MKKGLKVRFHDIKEMLKFEPHVFEFHLSDKDLDYDFGDKKYEQELVTHGPEYWERKLIDPCSTKGTSLQHTREKSVEIIQKAIDLTRKIAPNFKGEPMMVLHPGGMSLNRILDTKVLLNNLKKSLSELDKEGVKILLENMPPYPWFFGGQWCCNVLLDADEVVNFCREVKLDMCFDLSHAQLYCKFANKDLIEYIKKVQPLIKHIHIADAEGEDGEGLQVDEGEIDFAKVMPLLMKNQVTMMPEIWRGHENKGEGFKLAFERIKKYLKNNKTEDK